MNDLELIDSKPEHYKPNNGLDSYTKESQYVDSRDLKHADWKHKCRSAQEWVNAGKVARKKVVNGKKQLEYSCDYITQYLGNVRLLEQCIEGYESALRRDSWFKGTPMYIGVDQDLLPW